jgi:hypothetical protein
MSDTHACPIEGCKHDDVPVDRVLCFKHWSMVPRDLQNQVYRWAKVSSQRRRIQSEHLQAIRSAIEAVNDKCRSERLKETGIAAIKFPVWFNGNTNGIR